MRSSLIHIVQWLHWISSFDIFGFGILHFRTRTRIYYKQSWLCLICYLSDQHIRFTKWYCCETKNWRSFGITWAKTVCQNLLNNRTSFHIYFLFQGMIIFLLLGILIPIGKAFKILVRLSKFLQKTRKET